jgi:hypothetical protein
MNQRIAINRQQRTQLRRESALKRRERQERKIQRWLFSTKLSTASNLVLAVAKLALGVLTPSGLLCVSALFNIGMALSKHIAIGASSKSRLALEQSRRNGSLLGEYRSYRTIGIVLFASSMVFLLYSLYVMFVGVIVEYTLVNRVL